MNARQVKCPRCGKLTLFTPENANRPFCSERCKLIDLGAWAEEKYRVPVAPAPDADSEVTEDEGSGEQSGNETRGASSGDGPRLH